jgi:thiaminase/transcriptional activator TenA
MAAAASEVRPSVSMLLRARGSDTWEAAVTHPMVVAIGAGTLPRATFRRYFEQNVLYLDDYARTIGGVISRAPDRAAVLTLTRFLNQIVEHEVPANASFLERLGGTAPADPLRAMTTTTYGYTRHLLDVASRGSAAAGLAAILPCQWSYGELAGRLAEHVPDDPLYAEWIAMFANPHYDELVEATTGLLDRLCDVDDDVQVDLLSAVFDRSAEFELAFWDAAYTGPTDVETAAH